MRRILPYLACLLVLAACAKVEPVPGPVPDDGERKEIAFRANMDQDGGWVNLQTKADVSLDDLKSGGWGLYGYYTKTADYTKPSEAAGVLFNGPDYHGRQVRWDGTNSVWEYAIDADHKKEYWPMDADEKVSFFAYAPYSLYSANATVDNDNGPQVTYTALTDMTAQKDLLWGTNTSGLPHRNVNLATFQDPSTNPNGNVDMHFRHAPAKVHFTINGATLGNGSTDTPVSDNSTTSFDNYDFSDTRTGERYTSNNNPRYDNGRLYYVYRRKKVERIEVIEQASTEYKILLNTVEMTNFNKTGILHLNNSDSYAPAWTITGNDILTYSFNSIADNDAKKLNTAISNPNDATTLYNGWGTTYLGVDADAKELLRLPYNYIYMVPKQAVIPDTQDKNITITVTYHVVGLARTREITRTTTSYSYQRAKYFNVNGTNYYITKNPITNNNSHSTNSDDALWEDYEDANHRPSSPAPSESVSEDYEFVNNQDNGGLGFKAVGKIASDILGGRDYTVNLYLDGRELNLTVIPQPWDLHETTYDYNGFINPVEQSLTYDANFVYSVIEDKVYINNRMGKFYFRLGTGTYLYWQASLIGDDAFAFTDENGEYLRDNSGNLMTSIRGDLDGSTSYIYVKAINTASRVTSQAKLRIYLFNSENHAVVALPKDNWLFVSSTYIDGEQQLKRVQEWTVVQTAN